MRKGQAASVIVLVIAACLLMLPRFHQICAPLAVWSVLTASITACAAGLEAGDGSRDGDAVAPTAYSSPEANSQRTCSASRQAEGGSRADLAGSGGDDNGVQQQRDQPVGGGNGVMMGGPGSAPLPAAAGSGDSGGRGQGQGVSSVPVRFRTAYRADQQAPTKDRVRWTPELHQIFVDAVERLGGAIKAKVCREGGREGARKQEAQAPAGEL